MKKGYQITLADIASHLRVSSVTVSKALRGHPDISEETTRRVKKAAEELGYYPNLMARMLSSKRSNAIGVIVPKLAHFFFSSVIEAIYDIAFENNYEIILTVSQENAERELKHIQTLLSMKVDGLIISISEQTKDPSIFEKIQEKGVHLTFMDRIFEKPAFTSVVVDDKGGAFSAVEHAIKSGYKKIGHIGGYRHVNIGKNRFLGFEEAMKKNHVPLNQGWIIEGGFDEEAGYKGFKKMHAVGKLPDFIFCATFPIALGMIRATQELGLKVPQDIDLICFGTSTANRFLSPRISYVDQPTRELGRKAFELTLESIRNHDPSYPQHILLPTSLVIADTCVPKRK